PGLRRDEIPRPSLVRAGEGPAWLWRPPQGTKPRVAVLIAAVPTRPVFDERITALNFAGLAVLAVNGPGAQKAALAYLRSAQDLDPRDPLLLDPDGLEVEDPSKRGGIVSGQSSVARSAADERSAKAAGEPGMPIPTSSTT